MELTIREATEDDFDEMSEIYRDSDLTHARAVPQAFSVPEGNARSRDFISGMLSSADHVVLVAECDGRVVGLAQGAIQQTPDFPIIVKRSFAALHDLAVRHEFRRQGIGRALMERFEIWARDRGADNVELTVWAFNRCAVSTYKALGYEVASQKMWKFLK